MMASTQAAFEHVKPTQLQSAISSPSTGLLFSQVISGLGKTMTSKQRTLEQNCLAADTFPGYLS